MTLVPLQASSEPWRAEQLIRLDLSLRDDTPTPADPVEQAYLPTLQAIATDDLREAAKQLCNVLNAPAAEVNRYTTTALLGYMLAVQMRDANWQDELFDRASRTGAPDPFAQRVVADARLAFYRLDDVEPAIRIEDCLDQPALTAQCLRAWRYVCVEMYADAAKTLEGHAIPAWEETLEAWDVERKALRSRTQTAMREMICAILGPNAEIPYYDWRAAFGNPDHYVWGEWFEVLFESEKDGMWLEVLQAHKANPDEIRDTVIQRALESRPLSAPRQQPGSLLGFDYTVCDLYFAAQLIDPILDYTARYRWPGSALTRAVALDGKGLSDSAVVVLDEYLRNPDTTGLENHARYIKARILVDKGDRRGARRELARLYADDPHFEDSDGLRARIDEPAVRGSRSPISEDVRHAVWRRDEGKCVQCGSKENLEFDHVIPISRGGANTERNLQLLCEPCNRSKGADI